MKTALTDKRPNQAILTEYTTWAGHSNSANYHSKTGSETDYIHYPGCQLAKEAVELCWFCSPFFDVFIEKLNGFCQLQKRKWVCFTVTDFCLSRCFTCLHFRHTVLQRPIHVSHWLFYRELIIGMSRWCSHNYGYVTLFYKELQECHADVQRTTVMSRCFTEN